MSTKDYRTRDEIVISIKKGSRAVVDKDGRKGKGSAPTSKQNKRFLHRRKKPAAGITFFDLGQTRVGENWLTNNYSISPELDSFNVIPRPGQFFIDFLTVPEIEGMTNAFLATPVGSLATVYRKVLKSVGLAFPVYIELTGGELFSSLTPYEFWNDNGLELTEGQRTDPDLRIKYNDGLGSRSPFFYDIAVNNRADQKVTTIPDPGAADAVFELDATAQIFLVPMLTLHRGESTDERPPFPISYYGVFLNYIYRLRPRNFSDPGAIYEYLGGLPYNPASFNAALTKSLALSPTRAPTMVARSDGNPDTVEMDLFPFPSTDMDFVRDRVIVFENTATVAGQLTGIIRQGGQTFYFWQI